MEKKKYHFISGLPRSGSTLLANILDQNPRFHASGTSGILDVMFGIRNQWDSLVEFRATPNEDGKRRVLGGVIESYYSDVEKPVIFDKCRGWLQYAEMAEYALGEKARILVPIRDVRDVIASFEKLWRTTIRNKSILPSDQYFRLQTIRNRVGYWAGGDQPIGLAHARIGDAIRRGLSDRMHFVRFEELTSMPEETMRKVYEFLGEEWFDHDFDNVEQVNRENDAEFGFDGLHDIRPRVEPVQSCWKEVLGEEFRELSKFNF